MSYIILDLANTFSRSRFVTRGSIDDKIGMALNITLGSIRKAWNDFNGKHLVIACEGRSWRKSYYAPYKRNRADLRDAKSVADQEEDTLFWEALGELQQFFVNKTNCTVLQHSQLEADDLIAGFIQHHPNDNHVIISTDSDFHQLIADNVTQYNGVGEYIVKLNGYFDVRGNPIFDNKTKEDKVLPDPKWILFEKCIRGDSSDNVFSAYPGARKKGTKNKTGLLDAFADKDAKGYNWNNLMLTRWTDHNGEEHRVLDDYQRNVTLIDLTAQPTEIRSIIDTSIQTIQPKEIPMVGAHFIKYCGIAGLIRMSEQANSFSNILSAKYSKD